MFYIQMTNILTLSSVQALFKYVTMRCWGTGAINRGESRAAATSKIECFVIIVNGFLPLTIITKHSILDIAAALEPPLVNAFFASSLNLRHPLIAKFSLYLAKDFRNTHYYY